MESHRKWALRVINPEGFLEKEVDSELDFGRKVGQAGNRKKMALRGGQKWNFNRIQF